MRRPPRDPDEPLLSRFVVARTIYVGALMAAVAIALFLLAVPPGTAGGSPELARAQTLAVTSVAFFQIFYLLMCRTPDRTGAQHRLDLEPATSSAGSACCWCCRSGFVHLPFMQALFRTADLTADASGSLAAAAGAVVIPVVSAEKAWRRRQAVADGS